MGTDNPALAGRHVRLEPLDHRHVVGLAAAAAAEPSLYRWSPVPQGQVETASYVSTALAWRDAGTAVPFAIVAVSVRADDNAVIGSTRFWNLERWSWPQGHARHGRDVPDACEIGYTWLTRSAIRTAANSDQRSRAALERIGGKCEGILRVHRMAADFIPRDSVRYSILAEEWPEAREKLARLLGDRG